MKNSDEYTKFMNRPVHWVFSKEAQPYLEKLSTGNLFKRAENVSAAKLCVTSAKKMFVKAQKIDERVGFKPEQFKRLFDVPLTELFSSGRVLSDLSDATKNQNSGKISQQVFDRMWNDVFYPNGPVE